MTRLVAIVLMLGLLAACAGRLPLPATDWELRQQSLSRFGSWGLSGRLSVKTASDAVNGGVEWTQQGEQTELGFRGPLGVGGFRLSGDHRQMTYEDSRGERVLLDDPARVLATQLGWDVPLASLAWWVRGLPDPQLPAASRFGPGGHLVGLEQDGWRISYERYGLEQGLSMPGKITVERGPVRIRLLVRQWVLGPAR